MSKVEVEKKRNKEREENKEILRKREGLNKKITENETDRQSKDREKRNKRMTGLKSNKK